MASTMAFAALASRIAPMRAKVNVDAKLAERLMAISFLPSERAQQ